MPRVEPDDHDALGESSNRPRGSSTVSEVVTAGRLLAEWLAGGPRPKHEMLVLAEDAGISTRTLERAKQRFGVLHERPTFGGEYLWRLPEGGVHVADDGEQGDNGENGLAIMDETSAAPVFGGRDSEHVRHGTTYWVPPPRMFREVTFSEENRMRSDYDPLAPHDW
jgi:hypothetical protein